jgi:hypothetical protein
MHVLKCGFDFAGAKIEAFFETAKYLADFLFAAVSAFSNDELCLTAREYMNVKEPFG